jgi:hypothetical protein
MIAALDALNRSDDDRITAMTAYFKALSHAQAEAAEGAGSGESAKPLSPASADWMRRFQEAGVELATDEERRKAIAARLF